MIEEPYRWVEAVANRREYVEDQLKGGSPAVLLDYEDGLLLLTVGRETKKIFEIYDRIAFAALGHPADIERMRLIGIDLAHVEGFNRAATDVSLRRLVNFGMSPTLKAAFEQIFSAPYIVKILMAELGDAPETDSIIKLDYDGSFARSELSPKQRYEVIAGVRHSETRMLEYLAARAGSGKPRSLADALLLALETWAIGAQVARMSEAEYAEQREISEADAKKFLKEQLKSRTPEAAVLDRKRPAASKFRMLEEKEIRAALKDL
jgi:proteasome alpha subunit